VEVFIGGWRMKFNFLEKIDFVGDQTVKKWLVLNSYWTLWTNRKPPHRYRPCVLATFGTAVGTIRPGSSVGGTDRPGWSIPL
jgi:hypothetical protein